MRVPSRYSATSRAPSRPLVRTAVAIVAVALTLGIGSASASEQAYLSGAAARTICSGPNSAKVPCHFSTPSGNIRCVWTPVPNNVACVLRATGRAFRLRPTGRAKAIRLRLARRGSALPRNQQLVFPASLSCRDTRRTMTCNQDFGRGAFTLAPGHSHGS
jgi:hypothetical protein